MIAVVVVIMAAVVVVVATAMITRSASLFFSQFELDLWHQCSALVQNQNHITIATQNEDRHHLFSEVKLLKGAIKLVLVEVQLHCSPMLQSQYRSLKNIRSPKIGPNHTALTMRAPTKLTPNF